MQRLIGEGWLRAQPCGGLVGTDKLPHTWAHKNAAHKTDCPLPPPTTSTHPVCVVEAMYEFGLLHINPVAPVRSGCDVLVPWFADPRLKVVEGRARAPVAFEQKQPLFLTAFIVDGHDNAGRERGGSGAGSRLQARVVRVGDSKCCEQPGCRLYKTHQSQKNQTHSGRFQAQA